jgi:hypothetical protein
LTPPKSLNSGPNIADFHTEFHGETEKK